MDATIQGYMLTRLDGLKDMMTKQERLLEEVLRSQGDIARSVESSVEGRLSRLLRYWPQIVAAGIRHILTVLTIGMMIRQGADATSVLDFISKQF